jgi:hypothetical protein
MYTCKIHILRGPMHGPGAAACMNGYVHVLLDTIAAIFHGLPLCSFISRKGISCPLLLAVILDEKRAPTDDNSRICCANESCLNLVAQGASLLLFPLTELRTWSTMTPCQRPNCICPRQYLGLDILAAILLVPRMLAAS